MTNAPPPITRLFKWEMGENTRPVFFKKHADSIKHCSKHFVGVTTAAIMGGCWGGPAGILFGAAAGSLCSRFINHVSDDGKKYRVIVSNVNKAIFTFSKPCLLILVGVQLASCHANKINPGSMPSVTSWQGWFASAARPQYNEVKVSTGMSDPSLR